MGLALGEAFGRALCVPVGLALGEAFGRALCVPVGLLLGEAEPLGLGVAAGWGRPEATAATSRKRSCAVALTASTRSLRFWPGISTTIWLLPWVPTSDSETPLPLTRWSMIPRASSRLAADGLLPAAVLASSVIRVPPCRSRPSLGCHTPASATPPYRRATANPNSTSRRAGRACFFATTSRSSSTGVSPGRPRSLVLVVPAGDVVPPVERLAGLVRRRAGLTVVEHLDDGLP